MRQSAAQRIDAPPTGRRPGLAERSLIRAAGLREFFRQHYIFWLLLLLFVSFRVLTRLLLAPGGYILNSTDYEYYRNLGELAVKGYLPNVNLVTAYPPLFPPLAVWVYRFSAQFPLWFDPRLFFNSLLGVFLLAFETGNFVMVYDIARRLAQDEAEHGAAAGARSAAPEAGGRDGEPRGTQSSAPQPRGAPRATGEPSRSALAPLAGQAGGASSGTYAGGGYRTNGHAPASGDGPLAQTGTVASPAGLGPFPAWLWAPILYAMLFAPMYTWMGWFESMPLFFLLLGLDLLLIGQRRTWAWVGSAAAAALGFLSKLTPILLVPIAARWLGTRLNWEAIRREWFRRGRGGNLSKPLLYVVAFLVVAAAIGYPLVRENLALATSSYEQLNKRVPWETPWALMVGYYSYGKLPVDERDPGGLATLVYHDALPWNLITLAFGLLYAWLYTRRYDWQRPRTAVAFTGVTVLWLFLYSRGWSPQYQIWVMAFIVLLMPSLYGAALAVGLSYVNYAEAHLYLNVLDNQTWIEVATIIMRSFILIGLMFSFLAQIWPTLRGARALATSGRWLGTTMMGAALIGTLVTAPSMMNEYFASRLSYNPCAQTVDFLKQQTGQPAAIATGQIEVWENLYPWLRSSHSFLVLDDYSPDGDPARTNQDRLSAFARAHGGQFWWVEMLSGAREFHAADSYFTRPDVRTAMSGTYGACHLFRVTQAGGG